MQNSLSVSPKDQGESSNSSGTVQSGKNLQSKSQFRTIAPKIVPRVLTSQVLPCAAPPLPDQGSLGAPLASKPLGMPAQNYALMQVAGQEGTFSLVALPNVASAQTIQKPRISLPENLKLPIPRYQPPRNSKGLRKKPSLGSPESGWGKFPAPAQTCPQMCPSPPAHLEFPCQPNTLKQAPSLDPPPGSTSTAPLARSGAYRDSKPPVICSQGDWSPPATPTLATSEEPSAMQSLSKIPGRASFIIKETARNPPAVASEQLEAQVDHTKSMTNLLPTIFSNAVQLVSSVPAGKLPILPYTRIKTEACKSESGVCAADFPLPGHETVCGRRSCTMEDFHKTTKKLSKIPASQESKQSLCENDFCPATKPDLNHKAKMNGGATKKRARKRKVADEILAFQGKRRRCRINKCREGKERAKIDPPESRDQKPGTMRKYRSIMPKPVIVMSAVTSLASPAVLPSQTPGSSQQDTLLSSSLTPKYFSCKQNDSPSPKSSSGLRKGFSGIKKPWHRCHVCNHHFQFKQHLRDHMNTHTNRRPYSCRICRKAYVHPGSLSTHMNLHHSENRLKKLVCCEFCAKVFGHIRVYFGHLKEVHRVVISTEASASDPQSGDAPKTRDRDAGVRGMEGPLERENKSSLEEDILLNQAEEVKLQIKCGRCQITAQSFAEIKFHLLCVHGEEIQGRLQEGILPGSRVAQEALVKHSTPDWKPHTQRRKQVKPHAAEEAAQACPRLKRQLCPYPKDSVETPPDNEGDRPGTSEPPGPDCPNPGTLLLWSDSGFNCLLCAQTLGRKEDLLLHWEHHHNCEDSSRLWAILSAFSSQGRIELSHEAGK
ncbi:zinc finger protein 438 isoform X2 [Perognathus longimembris pacificus]|uniref:zinc finger protein 438 isoform X2 n=1 Tax=Perognathus longimembris pacificus TaxID=214514 RepID=UPI0020198310|nr:zinc finger protein 438 isoform X2 [Perognathus longimembris pacificus]